MGTMWEAMKVFFCGQVISYTISMNRRRTKRMTELVSLISDIDKKHSTKPCAKLYKEHIKLLLEYDSLISVYIEDLYLRSRQAHYEHGERASKLLSHQLRQSAADSLISGITTTTGETISDQEGINEQFKKFYENLYSSEAIDDPAITDFFKDLKLLTLSPDDAASLEGDIFNAEID